MHAPKPLNEEERLRTLRRYQVLDTPPEASYDDLTLLASEICGAPIAAISLVDEDRQWFKSILGLDAQQTSRDVAFCAHAILDTQGMLVVPDATLDERFQDNFLVTHAPGIRFYAGTPLVMSDGNPIGTLCVIDRVPRTISPRQRAALGILGREVVAQLELRRNQRELEQAVLTLERAGAELQQAQQEQLDLKNEFISHVSHELRSPLTPICQFASILLDGIGGPLAPEQREFVEIMQRNARQLSDMVGDLLDATRTHSGKVAVDRQRFRVEGVVTDLVRSHAVTAAEAGVTLTAEIAPGLPAVLGDAVRTRQVVANLLGNALKFTPAGGAITVHASVRPDEPDAVCVAVSDTGCGLSPADRDRVFERLYQVPAECRRSRDGLGLGLYISRDLVYRQGGRIWVESEEGRGSRFSFTLPAFSLERLLAPLLTAGNLRYGSFAVITIELVPAGPCPAGQDPVAAMDAAWELVGSAVHPAMDVRLPRFGRPETGETFVVAALADAEGADTIVCRLEERLSHCETVRQAGFAVHISRALLRLPAPEGQADLDGMAAVLARRIEDHLELERQESVV